jgi:periplasmic divalent cation tolerance protein
MTDKIVVFCTCASAGEAESIARRLVDLRLAACASLSTGSVRSVYRWKGSVEISEEVALTIKTRRALFSQVAAEIRRLHSYETPEIVALQIVDGLDSYLSWIENETEGLRAG